VGIRTHRYDYTPERSPNGSASSLARGSLGRATIDRLYGLTRANCVTDYRISTAGLYTTPMIRMIATVSKQQFVHLLSGCCRCTPMRRSLINYSHWHCYANDAVAYWQRCLFDWYNDNINSIIYYNRRQAATMSKTNHRKLANTSTSRPSTISYFAMTTSFPRRHLEFSATQLEWSEWICNEVNRLI